MLVVLLVGQEWFSTTEFVGSNLESDLGRVTIGFPTFFGSMKSSLIAERGAKSHVSEILLEILVVNTIVIVGNVISAFFGLFVVFEIDSVTSGRNELLVVGSNDTSGVEWVGSSFERVGLSLGSVEGSCFAFSSIGSWNPEFSDNHSTNGQSTSLVGTYILDTSQSFDRVHSSYQRVSFGEILGCSSEGQGDDGDKGCGKNGDGGSDGVCGNCEGDIVGESGGSDDNNSDDDGTSE